MRYIKTRWKENLCNSRGSMLWSLLDRNNNKEAKVYARGSKYQSVTPCSYFFNQASFRQTSLVSTNESRFDKRVSFRLTSLVSTNESRFDERVSFRQTSPESLFSNKWVSLKIVYRVTYKSWRFKIEWFPRNREWSIFCTSSIITATKIDILLENVSEMMLSWEITFWLIPEWDALVQSTIWPVLLFTCGRLNWFYMN